MSGLLILLSDQADDAMFVSQIAKECSLSIKLLRNVYHAVDLALSAPDLAAFFVDTTSVEQFAEVERLTLGKLNKNLVHGITDPHRLDQIERFLNGPVVGNIVLRRYGDIAADAKYYARIVRSSLSKTPPGMEIYMRADTSIEKLEFRDSQQKSLAASSVAQHLQDLGCSERVAMTVAGATDELLMNAIYDAPVDENGAQVFQMTSRDSELQVKGVELNLATEGDLIAVKVVDHDGSLNRAAVFKHISKAFSEAQVVRDEVFAGAGIGLTLVLRSGGSLYFVSEPNQRTEVTVFFKRTEKFKFFKNQFQFISSWINE